MDRDHYKVLGVGPTAEGAEIRAAYLALMRRHHPDADPDSEGSQRAQAINVAYAVLGDPERRARYDGTIAAHRLIRPERVPTQRRLFRAGPAAAILFSAVAAALVAVAIWPPRADMAGLSSAPAAEDRAAPERPAQSLPIPPSAHEARPEQPSAPAEVVVESAAGPVEDSKPATKSFMPIIPAPVRPVKATETVASKGAETPSPKPSASCPVGAADNERAVCASANLTALDRQATLLYNQSWRQADETKRTALLTSRASFIERRDMCETESCLTSAYVARLREISDIMGGRKQQ